MEALKRALLAKNNARSVARMNCLMSPKTYKKENNKFGLVLKAI